MMFSQVERVVESALAEGGDLQRAINSTRDLTTTWVALSLKGIVASESALADIAKRSFWHPNGFCKVVLLRPSSNRYQLRLHVWQNVNSHESSYRDVHTHRWDFASWIVAGSFKHELLAIANDGAQGERMTQYIWRDDCADQPPHAGESASRILRVVSESTLLAGDVYMLAAEALHRFTVREPGLSIVLQGPAVRTHSDVFKPIGHVMNLSPIQQSISANDLKTVLSGTVSRLGT